MPPEGSVRPALPRSTRLLAAQLGYQVRVLARTPRALWGGVMLPVLLLVIRHKSGQTHAQEDFAITGAAIFGLISTAYVTHATGLVAAREAGVLKRWRASPLPRWCFLVARSIATLLLASASGLLTILLAVVLYGLQLDARAWASIAIALLLGSAAWSAVGTAVTRLVPNAEAAWPILGLSYLPVIIISGAFGPIGEPSWLASVVGYLPAQPIIHTTAVALKAPAGGVLVSLHDVAVLAAWTVVGLATSVRVFRWEPQPPRAKRAARPAAR